MRMLKNLEEAEQIAAEYVVDRYPKLAKMRVITPSAELKTIGTLLVYEIAMQFRAREEDDDSFLLTVQLDANSGAVVGKKMKLL
jgi:uncharacterized membrane protein YkoI